MSVSKSVLSLGKITELDEKYMTPPQERDDIFHEKSKEPISTSEQQLQNINDLLIESENTETEHFRSFLGSEHCIESDWNFEDTNNITNDPPLSSDHPSDILDEKIGTVKEISTDSMFKDKKNYVTISSGDPSVIIEDHKRTLRQTFLPRMTIVRLPFINISPKTLEKIAFNKEKIVQTDKTILKNLELIPTIHTIHATAEYQINKTEVNKWCQGLKNVIKNLEMWSSWVENTCAYILFLKNNELQGRKIIRNSQKWINLKSDVNLDAALWFKLGSELQNGLLSYKNYYENTRLIALPLLLFGRTHQVREKCESYRSEPNCCYTTRKRT
ncbi:jg26619 [Pararge aegeria aegeria]|uniref:Jg26619 protein n=1 Tax=Pararge aegeria aegeria TaxID=348720 RepID=A0A8S4RSG5_9NEOP|nr:jg26619 [Pararge aegeria aegeria]